MRKPKFLSPSSKSRWLSNRESFYLRYLSDVKPKRDPQAPFMGIGSGFDAHVKAEIAHRAYGKPAIPGSFFDFEKLFESQVEPHHRDMVREKAKLIWDSYRVSGAFEALWDEIAASPNAPMMEDRIEKTIDGVPLLGLPDLVYIDEQSGMKIICDFKILGSASKLGGGASPVQGYQICRDGWVEDKPSNTHMASHKKYEAMELNGMPISKAPLETLDSDWADQMSTYAWMLGSEVGAEDFVVRIESAACRNSVRNGFRVKWATHMNRVTSEHQQELMTTYKWIWDSIEKQHIFDDLSAEDSMRRQEVLELQAAQPEGLHPALRHCGKDTSSSFYMRKAVKPK